MFYKVLKNALMCILFMDRASCMAGDEHIILLLKLCGTSFENFASQRAFTVTTGLRCLWGTSSPLEPSQYTMYLPFATLHGYAIGVHILEFVHIFRQFFSMSNTYIEDCSPAILILLETK